MYFVMLHVPVSVSSWFLDVLAQEGPESLTVSPNGFRAEFRVGVNF